MGPMVYYQSWCRFLPYFLLWIITQGFVHSEAKYIEGVIETSKNWMFLSRFCFYSEEGQFSYKIEYPVSYAVQNILLYYDEQWQWPAIYKTTKTCEEKESVLSRENRQILPLSERESTDCHLVNVSNTEGEPYFDCHGESGFQTVRERFWFIAISNCKSEKGLKLKYRIKMTNGLPGDLFHEHFSADEFGILEMSIAFLVVNSLLLGMSIFTAAALHKRHLLHTTYKLYLLSLFIYFIGILFTCLAYSRYATDGIGLPRTKLWGEIFQSTSLSLFLLLLLLLAKGYTVTRARIRCAGTLVVASFMLLYSFATIALFAYKEEVFDPGEVLYLYESPPGIWLIILKLLSWAMFSIFTVCTLKRYPEKAAFYLPFLAFYTLWFISGPVIVLFANYVIDKWVREKVVFGVEISIAYLAFFIFWTMTIPTYSNKNFPYHVRTTQIGVCHLQVDGTVTTNLDEFTHHAYAPSAPPMEPPGTVLTAQDPGLYHVGQIYHNTATNNPVTMVAPSTPYRIHGCSLNEAVVNPPNASFLPPMSSGYYPSNGNNTGSSDQRTQQPTINSTTKSEPHVPSPSLQNGHI